MGKWRKNDRVGSELVQAVLPRTKVITCFIRYLINNVLGREKLGVRRQNNHPYLEILIGVLLGVSHTHFQLMGMDGVIQLYIKTDSIRLVPRFVVDRTVLVITRLGSASTSQQEHHDIA